jgi:ParB-like chromosome segregation protein Spo0J
VSEQEKTTRELRIDPALRALLPRMTEAERAALREDIAERGMDYPILVDENDTILDGHHRYEAARSFIPVVPYEVRVRAGLTDQQKRALARAVNAYRRHLTTDQRREVLVKLHAEGYSTRMIADMAEVPHGTVKDDLSPVWRHTGDNLSSRDETASPASARPQRVQGRDRKTYPAQATTPEEIAERRQKVWGLIESGYGQRDVAKMLGVAQSTIAADWKARPGNAEEGEEMVTAEAPAAPAIKSPTKRRRMAALPRTEPRTKSADAAQKEAYDASVWAVQFQGTMDLLPDLPPAVIARYVYAEMRRTWPETVPAFIERVQAIVQALRALELVG